MADDKSKFLDVEDDEQRQSRIGTLLERLNAPSSSASAPPDPVLLIGREHEPARVGPPNELLARVKAFLPAISASNKALSELRPEDIDIEKLNVDEEEYIEMDLGLGVFEAKDPLRSGTRSTNAPADEGDSGSEDAFSSESGSDSESRRSTSSEEELESDDSFSSSSSSDDDSDSESQSGSSVDMRPVFSRPIKPLPRRVFRQAKQD